MLPLIDTIYVQAILFVTGGIFIIGWARAGFRFYLQHSHRQGNLIDQINAVLPQTQCGQCGFEGCLPYAKAIAQGSRINQCPPGGDDTIARLAVLLNEPPLPLNPAHGRIEPIRVAVIREAECIGCTKCIRACPVDAILGGAKLMHTVIAAECTGCDLCVEPCPVDCIDMVPRGVTTTWRWQLPSEIHHNTSAQALES